MAHLLRGIVQVGAIDASSEGPQKQIASDYGVTGFPTLKLFADDKANPIDVETSDPNEIMQFVMATLNKIVPERAARGPDGHGGNGSSQSSSSSSRGSRSKPSSYVVQLNSSNFEEKVYENNDVLLVAFVAPWCGHCKALHPAWEEAASKLRGKGATLGWVDATVEESLASKFGVKGFPTIKVFPGGKGKTSSSAFDYPHGREKEEIIQYALEEVDRTGVPKEISEMVSEDIFFENCEPGASKLCVFFALPHILDTGAEGRNKYRDIMAEASKAVRGMSFNFLWFEGGSQTDVESTLDLSFGFPAVAAYSMEKGIYSVHRGSFTEPNIRKFLTSITTGRQAIHKASKVPRVELNAPWDGKDGEPVEEEFSLEDIMGWDEDEPEL